MPPPRGQGWKCKGAPDHGWALAVAEPALCTRCHDLISRARCTVSKYGRTACHDPHSGKPRCSKRPRRCAATATPAWLTTPRPHPRPQGRLPRLPHPHARPSRRSSRTAAKLCTGCHKPKRLGPVGTSLSPRAVPDRHAPRLGLPNQLVASGRAPPLLPRKGGGPDRPGPAGRIDLAARRSTRRSRGPPDCHVDQHAGGRKPLKHGWRRCARTATRRSRGPHPLGGAARRVRRLPRSTHLRNEALPARRASRDLLPLPRGRHRRRSSTSRSLTGSVAIATPRTGAVPEPDKGREAGLLRLPRADRQRKVRHGRRSLRLRRLPRRPRRAEPVQLVARTNAPVRDADRADGLHVTAFPAAGHKVEGVRTRWPGRAWSCATRHDPHGSDNPKLFGSAGRSRSR